MLKVENMPPVKHEEEEEKKGEIRLQGQALQKKQKNKLITSKYTVLSSLPHS